MTKNDRRFWYRSRDCDFERDAPSAAEFAFADCVYIAAMLATRNYSEAQIPQLPNSCPVGGVPLTAMCWRRRKIIPSKPKPSRLPASALLAKLEIRNGFPRNFFPPADLETLLENKL